MADHTLGIHTALKVTDINRDPGCCSSAMDPDMALSHSLEPELTKALVAQATEISVCPAACLLMPTLTYMTIQTQASTMDLCGY